MQTRVLIIGDNKLACSVSVCLSQAGHFVTLCTDKVPACDFMINTHLSDIKQMTGWPAGVPIKITDEWPGTGDYSLILLITNDGLEEKRAFIGKLESISNRDAIIGISTDHIPLNLIQKGADRPGNIIGVNWAEPAHTTFFLELVRNENTDESIARFLYDIGKEHWKKDPYIISGELGIRGKMISAMIREAFYLVDNDYANVEDIDRACRNDAGTYLPFAGNFRYMDLMGNYAYGIVMKELNKELSTADRMPAFFNELVENKEYGMKSGKGFYSYDKTGSEKWTRKIRKFSYQIRDLMEKYP